MSGAMDDAWTFTRPEWLKAGFAEADAYQWCAIGAALYEALYARQHGLSVEDVRALTPSERAILSRRAWVEEWRRAEE